MNQKGQFSKNENFYTGEQRYRDFVKMVVAKSFNAEIL